MLKLEKRKARTTIPHPCDFRWCDWSSLTLALWLIASTLSFSGLKTAVFLNDLACGLIAASFSCYALLSRRSWPRWFVAITGAWLLLSPLIFWTESARVYEFDILAGCLFIAFTFLIPEIPGKKYGVEEGVTTPPGWSYNPSSWEQRLPLIWMGLIGFFAARYLSCYQLGFLNYPFDPFTGSGTAMVLSSDVSRAFPVSDAGLGAVSYIIDALAGAVGSQRRWRTMPWMVLLFGLLIIPAGVTSIVLVMLQPIAVGHWCSICLFTAALMLFMVPLAFDEVIASCQFLYKGVKEGKPFWELCFRGDSLLIEGDEAKGKSGGTLGVTMPKFLLAACLVSLFIMFIPGLFGSSGSALNLEYIAGALAISISVSALAEPCRSLRLLNLPLALVFIIAAFFCSGSTPFSLLADIIAGFLLFICSLPKGKIEEKYGNWNKFIV